MSQTIRRGNSKGPSRAGGSRRPPPPKTGPIDRVMQAIPMTEAQLHKLFLGAIFACVAALAVIVASFAGVPALAAAQLATAASDAGFEVRRVEVRGVHRMSEIKVYERVLAERDQAMPLLDLAGLRERLLELPYVDDARVSRQLPDTLVVDIVERVPRAVLRKPGGSFVLIDRTGHELEPVGPERAKRMMVLAGNGAGRQMDDLARLLANAPPLRSQVREAEWVGKRRWNLVFRSGQVLALPQGDKEAPAALLTFAKLDAANKLIGGKVAAFDMRIPDRIYLRVPGHGRELVEQRAAVKAAKRKE
ncbi:MAG: cell division protein FtsQ/DivIB [Novosphingobium sp.]